MVTLRHRMSLALSADEVTHQQSGVMEATSAPSLWFLLLLLHSRLLLGGGEGALGRTLVLALRGQYIRSRLFSSCFGDSGHCLDANLAA